MAVSGQEQFLFGQKDDVQIAASQRIPMHLRSDCWCLDNGDKKKYYSLALLNGKFFAKLLL
jgi:hypothetical protein